MTFTAPHIEYFLISPILVVLAAAVLGVLVEASMPRGLRYLTQLCLALVGLVGAAALTIAVAKSEDAPGGSLVAEGALALDGPTLFIWGLILVLALLSVLLFAERRLEGGVTAFAGQAAALPGTEAEREASTKGLEHTEVFPLLMFAVAGMLIFPAAHDLLTLFVGLEVLSLPLYLLCGLARRRRLLSQEAALKYFMLGAFSSGFVVYGIALVYGYAGSMGYTQIAEAVAGGTNANVMLVIGMALIAVGLLFKVGAAPFHAWTPDVYQGAPTPVTAFMATCTKVAAFGALMRLFYVAFGGARWDWMPIFYGVALLTMVVGSVLALTQTDIKRLFAYSSIAHAGFLLVGMLGARSLSDVPAGQISGVHGVLFYLVSYGFMTVAAFALITLVRDSGGEVTSLARWRGIGKKSPLLAGTMAFLLLAMAGIPVTSGFIAKWSVFAAALAGGAWLPVVVAVLVSAVAAFFYLKVIVAMFFAEPEAEPASVVKPSSLTMVVIAVGTLATLVLGVAPGPLLDRMAGLAQFIR